MRRDRHRRRWSVRQRRAATAGRHTAGRDRRRLHRHPLLDHAVVAGRCRTGRRSIRRLHRRPIARSAGREARVPRRLPPAGGPGRDPAPAAVQRQRRRPAHPRRRPLSAACSGACPTPDAHRAHSRHPPSLPQDPTAGHRQHLLRHRAPTTPPPTHRRQLHRGPPIPEGCVNPRFRNGTWKCDDD